MNSYYEQTGYISAYHNETVVIKCGGETLTDETVLNNVIDQVLHLKNNGVNVVLVHGGGDQIKQRAAEKGIAEVKRDGVRITSAETMDVVEEVMAELNADLVKRINNAALLKSESTSGIIAIGVAGTDFIITEKQVDKGLVGEPSQVHAAGIQSMQKDGHILAFNPVSVTDEGELVNVNADSAASALAESLGAKRMIFCTSRSGVLDKDNNVISDLTPSRIHELIDDGTISDGMVKKIRECERLLGSVDGVCILGSADTDSILKELYGDGGGTLLQQDLAPLPPQDQAVQPVKSYLTAEQT